MNYILKLNLQNILGDVCNKSPDNLLCKASEILGLLLVIIVTPIFVVAFFYHIRDFFDKTTPIKEKLFLPILILFLVGLVLLYLEKAVGLILLVVSIIAFSKIFSTSENTTLK